MIALSGCIEALFRDLPYPDRIKAVAELGVPAYEFWRFADKDLDALAAAADSTGLTCAGIVCDTGGPLVDAGNRENIASSVAESIEAASRVRCKTMIVTVGQELEGVSRKDQKQSIIEGLKIAAPLVEKAGITLVVEPLNVLVNHQGYYLATTAEAIEIADAVGSPNVKLLYDIYHQQITEGNLIDTITANIEKIGHFHMADVPGRHEPGTGEINYEQVFRAISETTYNGYIGLELWSIAPEKEALADTIAWATKYFG
jgi:hydroxypyruvate isomerase